MTLLVPAGAALRSSAIHYVVLQLGAKVIGLGFLLLAARAAPEAELGRFVSGALAAAVLALVLEFGRASHCVRLLSVGPANHAWARAVHHLRLTWLPSVPLLAVAIALEGSPRHLAQVLALGFLLAGNGIAEAALLAVGRAGRAASANVAYNGVAVVVLLVSGTGGDGGGAVASALLFAQLAGAAVAGTVHVGAVGFGRLVTTPPGGAHHAREAGQLSRAGVSHLLLFLSSRSDQLVLSVLNAPVDLGLYSVAARVNDAATSVPGLVTTAAQPGFVRALAGADRVPAMHRYLARLLSLSAALGLVVGFALPVPLAWALPTRYAATIDLLPILGVGMVGYGFQMFGLLLVRCASTAEVHLAHTWTSYGVQALVAWCAAFIGYLTGGLTGLALASAGVGTLSYAWVASRLMRQAGVPSPHWVAGVLALSLIATALASVDGILHAIAAAMLIGMTFASHLLRSGHAAGTWFGRGASRRREGAPADQRYAGSQPPRHSGGRR